MWSDLRHWRDVSGYDSIFCHWHHHFTRWLHCGMHGHVLRYTSGIFYLVIWYRLLILAVSFSVFFSWRQSLGLIDIPAFQQGTRHGGTYFKFDYSCSCYLVTATRRSGRGSAAVWDPVLCTLHYQPVPCTGLPSPVQSCTTWPAVFSTSASPVPRSTSRPVPSTPVLDGPGRGRTTWRRGNTTQSIEAAVL